MKTEESADIWKDQIKRRFANGFLDMVILQQIETEPTWGYEIIKKTEQSYKVKPRHGAIYPMLKKLKTKKLLRSRKEVKKGRVRKIYDITEEGRRLLHSYRAFLKEQIQKNTDN